MSRCSDDVANRM